jgi:hypothetical protein
MADPDQTPLKQFKIGGIFAVKLSGNGLVAFSLKGAPLIFCGRSHHPPANHFRETCQF